MLTVNRKKNETIDRLMSRFKKAFNSSGIAHDLKRKQYYIKPSEVKNRENADYQFKHKRNKKIAAEKLLKKRRKKRLGNW